MCSLESELRQLQFEDDMGDLNSLPYVSHRELTELNGAIYLELAGPIAANEQLLFVKYTNFDNNLVDHIVKWNGSTATKILSECGVSMESMSPTCLVQYQYEENGPWKISRISRQPLEMYQSSKFSLWRGMLDHPTCEAAFVRMLKNGPLNRIYDKLAFPIAEQDKHEWVITDEKSGKLVDIPRPVYALRIWNALTECYDPISPLLQGAPSDAELPGYWEQTLGELRIYHGEEYIAGLLAKI